jgi:NitT/TauT family transport system ATP-binding protein
METLAGTARSVPTDQPVVSLSKLAFAYSGSAQDSHLVLENIDLELARGDFIALTGQSGSGKSTLLRIIAGLTPAARGNVHVEAPSVPEARSIGLVFQDPRLLPWRRVIGNVEYGLEGLVKNRSERRSRALAALELVGLSELAMRWPHQLSGGQQQRVGIARALAVRPSLLLMDEPFGALDPATRHDLQDQLLAIWKQTRTTVVFVTHDIDEAVYLADRVIILGGSPAHIVRELKVETVRPRARQHHPGHSASSSLHDELYQAMSRKTQALRSVA